MPHDSSVSRTPDWPRFEGSCVVVTGAARGIGLALARTLLARGARVILSDIDQDLLQEALVSLNHPNATGMAADVTRAGDMAALAEKGLQTGVPLLCWVNNAGLARHRAVLEYTEAEISRMLDVNLKGTILGSQAALRAMSRQKNGHIINIISTASLRGIPGETVYCAAKWGARGFTQGLREEAAALGVRVTAVLPGGVDTDFWKDATERAMPVQDFLTAQQVADAVVSIMQMEANIVPQELVIRALRDRDFAQAP